MTANAVPYLLAAGALGLVASLAAQPASKPAAPAPTQARQVTWICSAFYLPARSIWKRTVDVAYDNQRIRAVQVDGTPVYSFSVNGTQILTAVDGERIQLDTAAQTWTSDLRDMVTAQGRCERTLTSGQPG